MSRLGKISLLFAGLSLVTFGVAKYLLSVWIPFFWILLGLVAFFLAAAVFVDRKFLSEFFTLKTTKHGMNMGALILLSLSFLIIVNYLGIKNSKAWDFSLGRNNTLSDQSVQILKGLDSDLKVLFFYKKGAEGNEENRKAFREVIKKYQDQTDKIKLNFYEVGENRTIAEEYGVTKGSGVAFLDYKGKKNRVEKIDEQEVTSALIKVTRTKNKNIYFVTGHKELDLQEEKDPLGLSMFRLLLENNSFNVKTLNLPSQPLIPPDADVVVMMAPTQEFSDNEVKAIQDYLRNGGRVFLTLEHATATLKKILAPVGIVPQNNFIKSSYMGIGYIDGGAIGSEFSAEATITKNFFGKQEVTRFGWPMDLKSEKIPPTIRVEDLIRTTKDASAFTKPEVVETNVPTGPFTLAVEVAGKYPGSTMDKEFALVVVGDGEFLTNGMLYQNLNRDFGLASISSLAKEEDLISITPREVEKTQMKISSVGQGILIFGIIIPIPILLLLGSLTLWLRRRNA